jgi:hypothetical protein
LIADAQRVKGLAPLACKTDRIDARVPAELSVRDLVPAIWLPPPGLPRAGDLALSAAPGQAPHDAQEPGASTLICFGYQVPTADLFGIGGRRLLEKLDIPEPWRARRRQPGADRRARAPDRGDQGRATTLGRGSPLRADPDVGPCGRWSPRRRPPRDYCAPRVSGRLAPPTGGSWRTCKSGRRRRLTRPCGAARGRGLGSESGTNSSCGAPCRAATSN